MLLLFTSFLAVAILVSRYADQPRLDLIHIQFYIDDGNDDASCVLLDHIPHNDCCSPSLFDPSTYTQYSITIQIPNVNCERCSLHLSNPMTDKIGSNGSPTGIGCTDPGTCFSVYHSCTQPFRILGDVESGAVSRSEYLCPNYISINEEWPTIWMGDNGETVNADTSGVYRRESSIWSTHDYTLTTAPVQYREDAGDLCGDGTTTNANETAATLPEPIALSPGQLNNSPSPTAAEEIPSQPEVNLESRQSSAARIGFREYLGVLTMNIAMALIDHAVHLMNYKN